MSVVADHSILLTRPDIAISFVKKLVPVPAVTYG
jgi:hypothetical protein